MRCESPIRRLPPSHAVDVSFSSQSVFVCVSVFVTRASPLPFLRVRRGHESRRWCPLLVYACCCGCCCCCFVWHFVAVFVVCVSCRSCSFIEQRNSSAPRAWRTRYRSPFLRRHVSYANLRIYRRAYQMCKASLNAVQTPLDGFHACFALLVFRFQFL